MRVTKATLKRSNKQKITLHLDGEPVTLKRKLKVRVVPEGLQVMVPQSVPRKLVNLNFKI
jgi:diacylglycerol kinase family enzyme